MAQAPTLSVMIPNYNHARFLPDLLGSLVSQPYRPLEIVVLDDCSTDDSVEVVEEWARKDPLIRLVRNERNLGVIANVNRLLEMARGDFVFLSAADDLVLPGFLEKCMGLLSRYPQAGLCSTLTRTIDENGVDQGVLPTLVVADQPSYLPPEKVRSTLLSVGFWIQGNTTIYRRAAVLEAGGYRPELHSFTDAFLGHVLALRYGACFIPEPLAAYRRMENSFAYTARSNPEIERAMLSVATELMQGEYRDLFPPGYAETWKDETLFVRARLAHALLRNEQEKFLGQLTEVEPPSGLRARLAYSIASLTLRTTERLLTACLVLGFSPGRVIRRQTRRLFTR